MILYFENSLPSVLDMHSRMADGERKESQITNSKILARESVSALDADVVDAIRGAEGTHTAAEDNYANAARGSGDTCFRRIPVLQAVLKNSVLNFGVFIVAALSQAAPSSSFAQAIKPQQFSVEDAKVVAYSNAFAKRFALPVPSQEMELTGGVQALEFSIETGPKFAPSYRCILKAYLDSSLMIAYPADGIAGSRALVEMPEHFFFYNKLRPDNQRWLALSVEDRLHFNEQNHFLRHAAIASPDLNWPTKGYWGELTYESFYRQLFPGVTYIKFSTWCGIYADAEQINALQLWIKQIGGKDYKRVVKPDPADFLKFNLPKAFLRAAIKWAKPADEFNRLTTDAMTERDRK